MGTEAGGEGALPAMLWKLEASLIFSAETPQLPPSAQKKLFDEVVSAWRVARKNQVKNGNEDIQAEDNASKNVEKELAELVQLIADLKRCHYRSVLFASSLARALRPLLLSPQQDGGVATLKALDAALQKACAEFVYSPSSSAYDPKADESQKRREAKQVDEAFLQSLRLRAVLLASVAAAELFMQVNWTGPPIRRFRPSELLAAQQEEDGRARFPDHPYYQRHSSSPASPAPGGKAEALVSTRDEGHGEAAQDGNSREGFWRFFSASVACRWCGRVRHSERRGEKKADAGAGARVALCFCEAELEAVCCLGPPDMPLTPQGKDAHAAETPRQDALQRLQDEAMEAFNADGEDVYELVRGLPYFWLACRLAAWLRGQNERLLSAGGRHLSSPASVVSPVFSCFFWDARLATVSQRILRGVSAAACQAPSLMRVSVDDLAASLKEINLLPLEFSLAKAPEDVRKVLEKMGVFSGGDQGSRTATRLLHDATEESQRVFDSLSSSTSSSSGSSFSSHPLLLPSAQDQEAEAVLPCPKERKNGDASTLPDSAWVTDREKSLMLLELSLHLLMYGKVDPSLNEVIDAACAAANIKFSFTGAEGIRRKYQQRAIAQLVVSATPLRPSPSSSSAAPSASSSACSGHTARGGGGLSPENGPARGETFPAESDEAEKRQTHESHADEEANDADEEANDADEEANDADEEANDAAEEARRRDWKLQDVHGDVDVLERPRLVDAEDADAAERPLDALEQALLLARGLRILETSPARDELAMEQLNAVAVRCLALREDEAKKALDVDANHHGPAAFEGSTEAALDVAFLEEDNAMEIKSADWLLYSAALWLRCKSEYHRSKTVERACVQLNALIDQFNDRLPAPSQRLRFIYNVDYPSWWQGKRELAFRMMHMGATLTAYESFKDLAMWEEAAECLYAADRRADAEELLVERLKLRESPPLWCTLGDLRKSVDCYEKAWTLSNQRCARAQRSLGHLYMREENYQKAAQAYARSLELNPLHRASWFVLGCCEMRLERWDDAVQAFGRAVALEPQDGDAWANLAAREAWTAARLCIGEAAKYRRESWRVWDNFLKISVRARDIRGVNEALRHYVDLNVKDKIPIWIYSFLEHAVVSGVSPEAAVDNESSASAPRSSEDDANEDRPPASAVSPHSPSSAAESGNAAAPRSVKSVAFAVEPEPRRPGAFAVSSVSSSPLFKSTLKTLEFLAQHVADQAELWKALSNLQAVNGDFLDAAETRLKLFRALSALLRRTEGPNERGAFSSAKALELQKDATDALREAVNLLRKAAAAGSEPLDIERRLSDIHTTACSLTEELRQRASAYDAVLQRPQLECLRAEAQELANQTAPPFTQA
ncbi:hypothetical protein NCLIV_041560 [Neospora caninum Liverpool]|uniref:Tetratricopeptide repeat protein 27 homolog n=1 Tax=Neospora caninum (strain Liverpool) TaxID=572307 RepID=F0VBU6_NEOCL|nr:hypothetical protein NCLIV_041560 [Neospora caninum Liverpool]CBZ51080.1 hypothetical protein NCLIV_041560 [Neospora caninum Liverpool]CEL68387.1 TPA: Tetratricopeptide repeat protein 27 homolog [Neospora caninum Liverpool]|eukprot:XP_003881113.1 hypothetical protein NCLIV_041560 [Neospora caninum Liverpool]